MGQSIDFLPPLERYRRYRAMADAAFQRGRHATDPEKQAEWMGLATGWHAMALELEANLRHLSQMEESRSRLLEPAKEAKPDKQL